MLSNFFKIFDLLSKIQRDLVILVTPYIEPW